ncbi:adhesion G-protein coupled receptor G5 isoform X2 [Rattus norvegicus]|uniref:adhesion G-protein coupled receptor G5 isoform X2 n=1 Tax=Rattus norvegicus TaxID=10116 RepID=UPI0003D09988|nr:adhesion G-protein coupled receptor G5 isoform X2 [Rattus norvegicus]
MDQHQALFFCLCLLAAQVVLVETLPEILNLMKRLERPIGRALSSRVRFIHHLEQMLLNASFHGHNLTLQTNSIQSLVFKLSCGFPGLSLSSATLTNVSQAWAPHAMQFPAELTKNACVTSRPAELRLICVYFFTAHLFQDDRNSSLLNNYVLGAQLDHRPVNNLQRPVNISFWHNRSLEGYTVTCVFWKEGAGKHSWGAWSPKGCYTEQPSPTQVLCHCNHLTYFAVLMQLSGDPVPTELQTPLEYISLVGCSISIVASLLTILLNAHSSAQVSLHGAGCHPTLRVAQQPYLDGRRRLQPLSSPGACLQCLHPPVLAQALRAGLGVSSPLGAASSDDQELSVWTMCDLFLQKPGKWYRLPECVHVLGTQSHGTQHPGYGLWWPHISLQPGGAGLGSVDFVQATETGEGTESLGLSGHCHGVGSHCATGHHLVPGLLLLQCVPAAPGLPLHHLQLALWFLPLPVVLLTEALLGRGSQGSDGGSQLLPDDTLTHLLPYSFSLHYFQQPLALAHPGKVVGWWRDNRVYCTLGGPFPSPRTTWG